MQTSFGAKTNFSCSSSIFSSSPSSYRTSGSGSMGGGGGGGTLGRRLGRPFSPAARDRHQPGRSHSREGGSCMRHMSPGGGTTSGGLSVLYPASTGTPAPQIESPTVSSAPPSLGVQVAQVKATVNHRTKTPIPKQSVMLVFSTPLVNLRPSSLLTGSPTPPPPPPPHQHCIRA
jgi:hypothetical protein